jgi:hypothetical protein
VYRGCHNRVARDCVIVENVTACYCEHSLCNGAVPAATTSTVATMAFASVICLAVAALVSKAS